MIFNVFFILRSDRMAFKTFSHYLLSTIIFIGFTATPSFVQAQQVQLGGHIGATGTTDSTKIGFGGSLTFVPMDLFGLILDASYADLNGSSYLALSPSFLYYLPGTEEMKYGVFAGAGFHRFENVDMKFAFNAGAMADFYLMPTLSVGALVRNNWIFDVNDTFNFFITLKFNFSAGDGW